MFAACQQANPAAILYVNDYDILTGKLLDPYVQQIRSLLDQGVAIGGIGVQGHIRQPITPQQVQKSLDTLAQFHLPIKITELDVVAATEAEQAQILTDVLRVAFAHPAVQGIYQWGFWEGAHWEPKAALLNKNFQPRPAGTAYQTLVHQQWWTQATGKTDPQGHWQTQAFFGDYEAIVTLNNQTVRQTFSTSPLKGQPQVVTIAIPPR